MANVSAWAIAVPAICATVVSPTVVALYATVQQRAQRRQEAADELRTVIDAAAVSISIAMMDCGKIDSLWRGKGMPTEESIRVSHEAMAEMRRIWDRLSIRIGSDAELTRAFLATMDAIGAMANWLFMNACKQVAMTPDYDKQTGDLAANVNEVREAFLAEARKIVGHDLQRLHS